MQKLIYLFVALTVAACASKKEIVYEAPPVEEVEIEILDTLTVTPDVVEEEIIVDYSLPVYNPEATRRYDIIHTKLDLAFDWENQHVLGKAHLEISPLFYPISQIALDAKQFDIHKVSLGENGMALDYTYDDFTLTVRLDKEYTKSDKISLFVDYTAKPEEGPQGGSAAITSDKGLFFINPKGEIENKPRQIWTQGETENNSKWFPTFDKPNERCTQEIYLTVEESLTTLSNGILVSSTSNSDGTKTDYWVMNKPHAPYLFMLAIGDFAKVSDSWNGKPLEYLVDPPYEESAKEIFNHTPEMLSFFSKILDYPYPWQKYSQVIAEDYVSGAMENTTAVIFGDFVQKTKKELIDNENDQIVAHEMFHHWFGDLVTCESWANLTLNEGFANYSEYLWYEHKYGKDAADAIRMSEMEGYFYMAQQTGTHPLIHYGYDDKEDMFDAHSYNKGGLVLHMLRNYVGDKAFFASLSKYLKDNAYTAVETAELRIAFEEITGEDLNWFFDQWYLDKGHPELEASYEITDSTIVYYVNQVQDVEANRPVFTIPLKAALYSKDGEITYVPVSIDQRTDTIVIERKGMKPAAVVLDGKAIMLGTISEEKSNDEWLTILKYSQNHFDKRKAISKLSSSEMKPLIGQLLNDKHRLIRNKGIEVAGNEQMDEIIAMVSNDAHSSVRATALAKLNTLNDSLALIQANKIMSKDEAYPVMKSALEIIYDAQPEKGLRYAEGLMNENAASLVSFLSDIFAESGEKKYLNYIENNIDKVTIYQVFNVFGNYSTLLLKQDVDVMMSKTDFLKNVAMNGGNMYKKFLAANTINSLKYKVQELASEEKTYENEIKRLNDLLAEIKSNETDPNLKARYHNF